MKIPQVQTPAPAPPPNQPAAIVNQQTPYNNVKSPFGTSARGTAALTIPLARSSAMGGVGPSGLSIPSS